MKKLIIFIAAIMITLTMAACVPNSVKGDDSMFIEVYDRDGEHIANIKIEEFSITRRVFEFDTSSFKGTCDEDVTEGLLFAFIDEDGNRAYTGFMKNITQEDGLVTFKGDDLRRIYDTEIKLDFTDEDYVTQPENYFSVENVFTRINTAVENQTSDRFNLVETIPTDARLTQFISNPSGQIIVVNAWQYVKVYLAYYNYYLEFEWDPSTKEIKTEFVANPETEEIILEDFVFDKTTTEVKTNHTVAEISDTRAKLDSNVWMYSSQELYEATPASLQYEYDFASVGFPETWGPVNFEDSFEDFDYDYVFRVQLWDGAVGSSNIVRTFYMQKLTDYNESIATATVQYFLGTDNNIYIDSIASNLEIYPRVTKRFDGEQLANSQYAAVWELVNNRYVEYIILTETTKLPIDIRTLTLYEFVTVHDAEGTTKEVPVSEIEWTHNGYKVKLGFKKTLLTEIIKGGN